jgi:uncharacterized membrane protein YdbT with pleckstrin-like domain
MTYINRVLAKDEHILHQGKIHWIVYARPVVLCIIGISLLIKGSEGGSVEALGAAFLFFAACTWLTAWIERITTEIAVTSRRVIVKYGLVWRSTMELNAGKIESVQVNQSVLGRILNFGTVTARGTGSGLEPVRRVDSPLTFRAAIGQLQASFTAV